MICFVLTHEDFYKIYFVSPECVVISSCWWRPKFHKLLTMRQAASVSSIYNSRKGCTAQYLAGAGVQKPEHFTLTFLNIWGPVEQGQQCLFELGHISQSYYSNCPSTQPSLSLSQKNHAKVGICNLLSGNLSVQIREFNKTPRLCGRQSPKRTALECYFS